MTRDDKRKALINKINEEIKKQLNNTTSHKFDKYDIDINEQIEYMFILRALSEWVNSEIFLTETYPNGKDIIDDKDLDIMLNDGFDFIFDFMMLIKEEHGIYFIGLYFKDTVIKQKIIKIFDYILYDKEKEMEKLDKGDSNDSN